MVDPVFWWHYQWWRNERYSDLKEKQVEEKMKNLQAMEGKDEKAPEPKKSKVAIQPLQLTIAAIIPSPEPKIIWFESLEDALDLPMSTIEHLWVLFL